MISLNKTRVEQLQVVLIKDDDFVEFAENGKFDEGLYYVANKSMTKFGKYDKEEGSEELYRFSNSYKDKSFSDFYKEIADKQFVARVFLGWRLGKEEYLTYNTWDDLAKAVGVSELATMATKVPKVIAKRFELFANKSGGRSKVLRDLVYDYVKKQMVDKVEDLMFQEDF